MVIGGDELRTPHTLSIPNTPVAPLMVETTRILSWVGAWTGSTSIIGVISCKPPMEGCVTAPYLSRTIDNPRLPDELSVDGVRLSAERQLPIIAERRGNKVQISGETSTIRATMGCANTVDELLVKRLPFHPSLL